jgi:hypothetical protein
MEKIVIQGPNLGEVKRTALKYSIKNAYEHDGKAQAGTVLHNS